jgi:chemotaxis protein CheZ
MRYDIARGARGRRVVQQKLFRIEQMVGDRRAHAPLRPMPVHAPHTGIGDISTLNRELGLLRAVIARNARELSGLLTEGKEKRLTRAAGELGAAVEAMEKATDNILRSAEQIDDCAKALAFAQMTDYERSLAQDIQEHVVMLYEACNFQDLTGQRIGKVIVTLGLVEDRLSDVVGHSRSTDPVAPAASAHALVNGPRLDGDAGHASQFEIDALFD